MTPKLHDERAQLLNEIGLSELADGFAISLGRRERILEELKVVRERLKAHDDAEERLREKLQDQLTLRGRCLNIRIPGTNRLLYVGHRQGYIAPTIEILPLDA